MFLNPSVKLHGDFITVNYVARGKILNDIERVFKTSRVNNNMFKRTTAYSLTFQQFFALEFYHILELLIESKNKYLYTSTRQLRMVQAELVRNTWLANIYKNHPSRLDYSKINNMHFKPLDHQMEFLKNYDYTLPRYNLRGMLLAAAAGSGKTNTSLTLAEMLDADKIIIVCPKPTVNKVWVTSCANLPATGGVFKKPQSVWSKESGLPYKNERIAIFHYEALQYALDMKNQLQGKRTVIILDESHNLNEIISARTQKFIELCNTINTNDVLLMSGTPIKALSSETIPLFKCIDPLFNDDTVASFKKMFAGEVAATTAILSRRYNLVSHRVEKKTLELPEPIKTTIKITVPNGNDFTLQSIANDMVAYSSKRTKELTAEMPAAIETYDKCVKLVETIILDSKLNKKQLIENEHNHKLYKQNVEVVKQHYRSKSLYLVPDEMRYCTQYEKRVIIPNLPKELKEPFIKAKTMVKYLNLMIRGEMLGRVLGKKRIEAFCALAENIKYDDIIESTDRKTIVFTSYKEVIETAVARLKKMRYVPLAMYGEHTKNLASVVTQFDQSKELNPLVATYASLGTGVPLIMADTIIFINASFRSYITEQAIARVHRLGQTSQTRIFDILLDTGDQPNISTRTIDIMEWSKNQVSAILGIENTDTEDDLEIATEDLKLVLEEYNIPNIATTKIARNILSEW